jgi:hypothetical protein
LWSLKVFVLLLRKIGLVGVNAKRRLDVPED